MDKEHLLVMLILISKSLMLIMGMDLNYKRYDAQKQALDSIIKFYEQENDLIKVKENKNLVHVCNIFDDGTADCGRGDAINPYIIEIYGDCDYKFVFIEDNTKERQEGKDGFT